MKKIFTAITIAALTITFSSTPARADRKTMEGFLLGTGVTLLGAAIIHEINRNDTPAPRYHSTVYDAPRYHSSVYRDKRSCDRPVYRHKHEHKKWKKHHKGRRGHWEVDRVWIEPVYERKWNPGHYNRRGKWISGRYVKFEVASGYWKEEKSWVWH